MVKHLQAMLVKRSYDLSSSDIKKDPVDGVFGGVSGISAVSGTFSFPRAQKMGMCIFAIASVLWFWIT